MIISNHKKFKNRIIISFLSLFYIFMFNTLTLDVKAAPEDKKVYDEHQLFTKQEQQNLEDTLKTLSAEGEVDILIITTSTLNGQSRKQYLEDFYDSYGPGYEGEFGSATLMLLNMDPKDRGVEIQGYKEAERLINNSRIENILDTIYNDLVDGNYYNAVMSYAKEVVSYMEIEPYSSDSYNTVPGTSTYYDNQSNNYSSNSDDEANLLSSPITQGIIALIIGGITVGVMASDSGGRTTTTNRTYLDSNKAYIPIAKDHYIRTTVTKVKKPDDNNNNNSSGGGVSSGGHSHSGGGRSF